MFRMSKQAGMIIAGARPPMVLFAQKITARMNDETKNFRLVEDFKPCKYLDDAEMMSSVT